MGQIKLQVPAGAANPSPPIGPALGQRGLNIMEFCKTFNARTQEFEKGMPIPVIITYYQDKSFSLEMKTPPASFLLKKAAKIDGGSKKPGLEPKGSVTQADLRKIAEMTEVVSVRQKRPLGLGHAVLCARDLVGNEPFAVLLADDLIDSRTPGVRQLLDVFEQKNESVIALMKVATSEVSAYGIIRGKEISHRLYSVQGTVEKPAPADAPSRMAIIGRYVLRPEIFTLLEKQTPGRGGEIQLTDGLNQLARRRKMFGCEFRGERYDIGDKFGFVRATVAYALKRPDLEDKVRHYIRSLVDKA